MKIDFVKVHPDAQLPRKWNDDPLTGDAGFDLFSIEEVTIPAGKSAVVGLGIEVGYITPGYWVKVEGRSGLAFKKEVDPHFGIFDNSYRGESDVKLFNSSSEDVTLPKGYAVAQMIVHRMIDCKVGWVDTHSPGTRGRNGLGSSDVNTLEVNEPEVVSNFENAIKETAEKVNSKKSLKQKPKEE